MDSNSWVCGEGLQILIAATVRSLRQVDLEDLHIQNGAPQWVTPGAENMPKWQIEWQEFQNRCQIKWQNICQKVCQNRCQRMSEHMLERERMSEYVWAFVLINVTRCIVIQLSSTTQILEWLNHQIPSAPNQSSQSSLLQLVKPPPLVAETLALINPKLVFWHLHQNLYLDPHVHWLNDQTGYVPAYHAGNWSWLWCCVCFVSTHDFDIIYYREINNFGVVPFISHHLRWRLRWGRCNFPRVSCYYATHPNSIIELNSLCQLCHPSPQGMLTSD